jgi:benzoylformate decarboxylase
MTRIPGTNGLASLPCETAYVNCVVQLTLLRSVFLSAYQLRQCRSKGEPIVLRSPISLLDKSPVRRGAEVLIEVLRSEGVQYIFGNPGTTELPLIDALCDVDDIQYILALQEATAVAMADGYAQAARRPGFLNLHTSGGLGHGMGNLLNANISQTPLVVTAGQQDLRHTVTDPLLFGDSVRIAGPAVKWAQEVTEAAHIPVLVRRAFNDAMAAPRGPVFLSLPMDVMEEMSSVEVGERSLIECSATAGSLDSLAKRLAGIVPGRLAIVAGDEIYASDAAAETIEVANELAAPVFGSSWPSRIPFPTAHPLWAGNLPTKATDIAQRLSRFDAIFALGGKSLITILYTEGAAIPAHCELFQLSADVRDLGRTYKTSLSTVGDIKASLCALLPLLRRALAGNHCAYTALQKKAKEEQQDRRDRQEAMAVAQMDNPTITPLVAAREAVRAIGPDIAIVDEAIATSAHVREFLNSWSPRQYSFLRGGALGWGMPAAVGCSLGLSREPVVCLVGDGAALYSPQALWTAAHERLPVTFVVMNNREYNVLKNFMRLQAGYRSALSGRFIAMDIQQPAIDYLALAQSMGVSARRIERSVDISAAIEAGIQSAEPNLIEVIIASS